MRMQGWIYFEVILPVGSCRSKIALCKILRGDQYLLIDQYLEGIL